MGLLASPDGGTARQPRIARRQAFGCPGRVHRDPHHPLARTGDRVGRDHLATQHLPRHQSDDWPYFRRVVDLVDAYRVVDSSDVSSLRSSRSITVPAGTDPRTCQTSTRSLFCCHNQPAATTVTRRNSAVAAHCP